MNSSKLIYSSTVSIPDWNKLFDDYVFNFSFFFICFFFLPSPSTVGPLERLAPAIQPRWRGGWLVCVERTRFIFCCSPTVKSSVLGTVGPRANFARGNTALPRAGARNHARVKQVVLFQDDRKHHQEFRAVLFPFSREDLHRFPLRVQAVSPYRRKPQDPWGPSWPRLCSQREESGPRSKRINKPRDRTGGYRFRHRNSCGTRKITSREVNDVKSSVRVLRMR